MSGKCAIDSSTIMAKGQKMLCTFNTLCKNTLILYTG